MPKPRTDLFRFPGFRLRLRIISVFVRYHRRKGLHTFFCCARILLSNDADLKVSAMR